MIKFVGGSYQLNTRKADVQRAVNLMPVANEMPGGKSVAYLDSTPGLTAFSTDVLVTGSILLESSFYLLQETGGKLLLE